MTQREPIGLVLVGNNELPVTLAQQLDLIEVTFHEKKATVGRLAFRDPDFMIMDSKIFKKGVRIALVMGWLHEMVPLGPFIVKGYSVSAPAAGTPKLQVKFQDKSHKMNKKQKRKRRTGSAVAIIKEIAEEHDLGYDIDTIQGLEFNDDFPLIQANLTDAALMQRLAYRYGYFWGVNGNNLYFKRPADYEEEGVLSSDDISVLSYRINDHSLKSFTPQIKFSKGGKRKAKNTKLDGLDALGNEVEGALGNFAEQMSGNDAVSDLLPAEVTDLLKTGDGQEPDDSETAGDNDWSLMIDSAKGLLTETVQTLTGQETGANDDENEESVPGNKSGSATPADKEEAKRQAAGKILRAAEIITGKAEPAIASMRWKVRDPVIFDGVGSRLAGKYRLKQITQSVNKDGFHTVFDKVVKKKYLPTPKSKAKINEEAEKAGETSPDKPGHEGTAAGTPSKAQLAINSVQGTVKVQKVDGVDQ